MDMTPTPTRPHGTARAIASAWTLLCPACHDVIYAPNGSELWTADDCADGKTTVTCGCGVLTRLPKAVRS